MRIHVTQSVFYLRVRMIFKKQKNIVNMPKKLFILKTTDTNKVNNKPIILNLKTKRGQNAFKNIIKNKNVSLYPKGQTVYIFYIHAIL